MCAVDVAPEGIAGDSDGGATGVSVAAEAAIPEGDVGDSGGSEGSLMAAEVAQEGYF